MKAKITQKQVSNGYSYWEKELVNTLTLVAVHKGEIVEPVVARFWMGRSRNASTVYCSIWINDRKTDTWASGKGTAGGWGVSQAISRAAGRFEQRRGGALRRLLRERDRQNRPLQHGRAKG